MMRRYRHTGALLFIPTIVASNTAGSSTSTSQSYATALTGEPGSVVQMQVTTYTVSGGATPNYTINSVTHILNDIVSFTLDGSGNASFTQVVDVGTSTTGNGLDVILTIISTTIGSIGIPNSSNCSKVI